MIRGLLAGYRLPILAASVLAAMGLVYLGVQYIQDTGKQELQIEQLETEIERRERIDEAIRTAPRDGDGARSVLRDFLDTQR